MEKIILNPKEIYKCNLLCLCDYMGSIQLINNHEIIPCLFNNPIDCEYSQKIRKVY